MTERFFLFLLLFRLFTVASGSQFCASDPDSEVPPPDPVDKCTPDSWSDPPAPYANRSKTEGMIQDCTVLFLIDLGTEFTSEEEFDLALFPSLQAIAAQSLSRGVGYNIVSYPMFRKSTDTIRNCCSEEGCESTFSSAQIPYTQWVSPFGSNQTLYPDSADANFTYVLTTDFKSAFEGDNRRCLYNTVVLFTNRMFASANSSMMSMEMSDLTSSFCISLTVILVGRPDISERTFSMHYMTMTQSLYYVPDIRCLSMLGECIPPCRDNFANECEKYELSNCPYPTTPATTPRTRPTHTTEPADPYGNQYMHVMYLFALSNATTQSEFTNALYYVKTPLADCINQKQKMVVRFFAEDDTDSGWMTDIGTITSFIDGLKYDEIIIPANRSLDKSENYTLTMVHRALLSKIPPDKSVEGPKLILLTDFVSINFLTALRGATFDVKLLNQYDFEVYAFEQEVADEYTRAYMKASKIHVDKDFTKEGGPVLCPKKKASKYTFWIILIGASFGAMIILLICTVLYRQKLMWMEKLNRFKTSNGKSEDGEDDIIDYWELSWDKLIVRSERLGHGAYGQVYKGKLIGSSPGLEHYYRHESAQYIDCDCAVKMLPKHANEKAQAEFMHEIDLMKSLGFNEHLVNMLGCITSSINKSCLLLEYCSNRDLLRYLKKRKAELEVSRSIDEQIDCTKEFLHFAWQVASGMKFLGSKNIIHRDLAARNILIDEMKNAKIADFGLCMQSASQMSPVSGDGRLPIKWLAIESLQSQHFSYKSDVWSYGIVLFEMYSMGEIPYSDIEPSELLNHLIEGVRPKRPLLSTDKLWEVMNRCWDKEPQLRPAFDELLTIFTILLEQATEGYGYLSLIKSSEHYRTLEQISPLHVEEIEDDAKGRSGSGTSKGPGLAENLTNVLRRTAAGISRQFSAGRDPYNGQETMKPALERKKKDGVFVRRSRAPSADSIDETVQAPVQPRRKSNDFFSIFTTAHKRKSFDPQNGGVSKADVPEINRSKNRKLESDTPPNRTPPPIPLEVRVQVSPETSDTESELASLPSSPRASTIYTEDDLDG